MGLELGPADVGAEVGACSNSTGPVLQKAGEKALGHSLTEGLWPKMPLVGQPKLLGACSKKTTINCERQGGRVVLG
jgi:hypothetical protein